MENRRNFDRYASAGFFFRLRRRYLNGCLWPLTTLNGHWRLFPTLGKKEESH